MVLGSCSSHGVVCKAQSPDFLRMRRDAEVDVSHPLRGPNMSYGLYLVVPQKSRHPVLRIPCIPLMLTRDLSAVA